MGESKEARNRERGPANPEPARGTTLGREITTTRKKEEGGWEREKRIIPRRRRLKDERRLNLYWLNSEQNSRTRHKNLIKK